MNNLELLKITEENDKNLILHNSDELEKIEKLVGEQEELVKKLKEQQIKIKEALITTMIKYDVKTFNTENYKITVVPETTRITLDTTKIKEEAPEIYDKYKKVSKVKASLRVTKVNKNEREMID